MINLVVLGVLSGLLSALTCRYVERPALRRKTRRQPEAHQPDQPAAGVVVLELQAKSRQFATLGNPEEGR